MSLHLGDHDSPMPALEIMLQNDRSKYVSPMSDGSPSYQAIARDPTHSFHSFRSDRKAYYILLVYTRTQHFRGFAIISYINHLLTVTHTLWRIAMLHVNKVSYMSEIHA